GQARRQGIVRLSGSVSPRLSERQSRRALCSYARDYSTRSTSEVGAVMRVTKALRILFPIGVLVCGVVARRAVSAEPETNSAYAWNLPKGFPRPYVPADNPMTVAKVELGRYLFYDTRLSVNGKSSCGTCHQQELAFTDGKPVGVGATGEEHSRS